MILRFMIIIIGINAQNIRNSTHYYAFGLKNKNLSVESSTNRQNYNGKEDDETLSLTHYGARFYDPAMARWTTVDPIREFNTGYSYVGSDPINLIDPDGRQTRAVFIKQTGQIIIHTTIQVVSTDKVKRNGKKIFINESVTNEIKNFVESKFDNDMKSLGITNLDLKIEFEIVKTKDKLSKHLHTLRFKQGRESVKQVFLPAESEDKIKKLRASTGQVRKKSSLMAITHEIMHYIGLEDRYPKTNRSKADRTYPSEWFTDTLMGEFNPQSDSNDIRLTLYDVADLFKFTFTGGYNIPLQIKELSAESTPKWGNGDANVLNLVKEVNEN